MTITPQPPAAAPLCGCGSVQNTDSSSPRWSVTTGQWRPCIKLYMNTLAVVPSIVNTHLGVSCLEVLDNNVPNSCRGLFFQGFSLTGPLWEVRVLFPYQPPVLLLELLVCVDIFTMVAMFRLSTITAVFRCGRKLTSCLKKTYCWKCTCRDTTQYTHTYIDLSLPPVCFMASLMNRGDAMTYLWALLCIALMFIHSKSRWSHLSE